MEKFLIRPFEEDDRSAVKELWKNCGLIASYNNPDDDIDFALTGKESTILVGIHADKLIASVMTGHDGHRGWLYYVAVDDKYRKTGIGRKIVAAAENWLKKRKVRKSMLLIRENNTSVQTFYEQLGYESAPRIVMQRWL